MDEYWFWLAGCISSNGFDTLIWFLSPKHTKTDRCTFVFSQKGNKINTPTLEIISELCSQVLKLLTILLIFMRKSCPKRLKTEPNPTLHFTPSGQKINPEGIRKRKSYRSKQCAVSNYIFWKINLLQINRLVKWLKIEVSTAVHTLMLHGMLLWSRWLLLLLRRPSRWLLLIRLLRWLPGRWWLLRAWWRWPLMRGSRLAGIVRWRCAIRARVTGEPIHRWIVIRSLERVLRIRGARRRYRSCFRAFLFRRRFDLID